MKTSTKLGIAVAAAALGIALVLAASVYFVLAPYWEATAAKEAAALVLPPPSDVPLDLAALAERLGATPGAVGETYAPQGCAGELKLIDLEQRPLIGLPDTKSGVSKEHLNITSLAFRGAHDDVRKLLEKEYFVLDAYGNSLPAQALAVSETTESNIFFLFLSSGETLIQDYPFVLLPGLNGEELILIQSRRIAEIAVPPYEIINQSTYVRYGLECTAYRVVIDPGVSDLELYRAFESLAQKDTAYMYTVWFYATREDVETGSYTVAQLEQINAAAGPILTRKK